MNRPKLLAFVKNPESAKTLKEFAAARGFPTDSVVEGNIENACTKILEGARSPEFLFVELTSKAHKTAFSNLDKLANCCEPDTKVIITGDIDELSFYKELMNMGVNEYLLNPIKTHQLERVLAPKPVEEKKEAVKAATGEKANGKVIAIIGTRGGSGASTVAVNLAKIFSGRQYPTVLLDFDPDFGVLPLLLDIEPNRGLIDALEKPERVDALFLDRVMTRVNDTLFAIGAERNLHDGLKINEKAAQVLFDHLKSKFAYVVIDIPRVDNFSHYILQHAENIIVTELSIPGLRDTMRINDLVSDTLGNKNVIVVANKVGVNKKFETALKDFEGGLGRKLDYSIAFEPEVYGYNNSGEAIVDKLKDSKFSKAMQEIAAKFMPESVSAANAAKPKKAGLFATVKSKK